MLDEDFEMELKNNSISTIYTVNTEFEKYYDICGDDFDPVILGIQNYIVVGNDLGFTYDEIRDSIYDDELITSIVTDGLDKLIVLCVAKYAFLNEISGIDKYFHLQRNIYKEVTAIKHGIKGEDVTEDMIATTKLIDDKNSYSVEGDPIVNWDEYFYNVSITVGRNSKCLSRRIGAVLVKDKSIISTGYNGPPRGIPTCDLRWQIDSTFREKYKNIDFSKKICSRKSIGFASGQGLEICVAGHAERNALINAARNGIKTKGTTLYMSCGVPCSACLVEIINAGVVEIVVTTMKTYDESAMYLLENSNLKVRLYDFL